MSGVNCLSKKQKAKSMFSRFTKFIVVILTTCLLLSSCGFLDIDFEPIIEEPSATASLDETEAPKTTEGSKLVVTFIDVGQADSILLECDGSYMLIDGGNVADSDVIYTILKRKSIETLDYVINTHAHEDHVGGLSGALSYAKAIKVYASSDSYDSKAFTNFKKKVTEQGNSIIIPGRITTFTFGSCLCKMYCPEHVKDENNNSIVVHVTHGNNTFLFAGDAENEEENLIMESGFEIESKVLKVGHHGSDTSTGYLWLRTINPTYAVISVGTNNKYNHPTEACLSKLRDAGVKTFRTDYQGDIVCVSDGENLTWTVSKNEDVDTLK